MKNIAAQMVNFDREQMRRIANNMPEQYDEKPQVQQVAQIINGVFSQLLATFPASLANRDQNELNEIRRQWVLAFRENGITTMEQVNAGMRVARRQNRPFLPSPGQFVAWCREEASVIAGLNRPGFPGECFICELRLPDHRFRWKHNKLFLLLPEEYGPAFPAIVDCYTSPPT